MASDKKLVFKVTIRIPESFYKKLQNWKGRSNCRTVTEVARAILFREKIIWYHKDAATEALTLELAMLRREINAIGNNINQITRYFNQVSTPGSKLFQATKLAGEFSKVIQKIDEVARLIERTIQKWSSK